MDVSSNDGSIDSDTHRLHVVGGRVMDRSDRIRDRLLCCAPKFLLHMFACLWNNCIGKVADAWAKVSNWGKCIMLFALACVPLAVIMAQGRDQEAARQRELAKYGASNYLGYSAQSLEPAMIFEINRHGARAPYFDNKMALDGYTVALEMLTPMGMRQRSLLGRYGWTKYKRFLGLTKPQHRVLFENEDEIIELHDDDDALHEQEELEEDNEIVFNGRNLRTIKHNNPNRPMHRVKREPNETMFEKLHRPLFDKLNTRSLVPGAEEIFVHSTDVYRTIQSAYAELTGLLGMWQGHGQIKKLSKAQASPENLSHMQQSIPFKVRRAYRIDYELGEKAIVDGFIGVPVYTYMEHPDRMSETDSLDTTACSFAAEAETYLGRKDSSYGKHNELVSRLNESVSNALNLTDDERTHMDFYNMTKYTDTIFARRFEGLPIYHEFTKEQLHDIFEVNKWA